MDAACNVVYVDREARQERLVRRGEALIEASRRSEDAEANEGARRLQVNVQTLLGTFNKVYVCPTGLSCLARIARLNSVPTKNMVPTLVVIDVPEDDEENERRVSPPEHLDEARMEYANPNLYGSHLLREIVTEVKGTGVASMVVPVVVVIRRQPEAPRSAPSTPTQASRSRRTRQSWVMPADAAAIQLPQEQTSDMKYVDLGAVDVLDNPIRRESLSSLAINVYRIHRQFLQRGQQLTAPTQKHECPWPGVPTPEPFAYLREVMVTDLSGQICGTVVEHPLDPVEIQLSNVQKGSVIEAISEWGFSAHELSDDELLYACVVMLEHALNMEEVKEFRLPRDKLLKFLAASRKGYNAFVPYHNFRHVVDVLQAVFHLLVRIGSLPPFPGREFTQTEPKSKIAAIVRPFEALTLLIAAIGHDVGHPGVNNMFLVKIKAPLASLYNDKSVLESYHTAVYCHMLKRLWPAVVNNEDMKQLLASSILSTDMGIHNAYIAKLTSLQESIRNLGDAEIDRNDLKTYRDVVCNLLIKCADISNVARPFKCAARWTTILTQEFARQAAMETEIELPSTLFSPPAREMYGLAKSQTGFMTYFALPLFEGVAELMPTTDFCVREIKTNHDIWSVKMEEARQRNEGERSGDREGSDDSVDNNNPPATGSSAMGAASGAHSGGPGEGSSAAPGGQPEGGASTHPDLDGGDVPPTLVRGQQRQSNSRPNSRPVTWDEASANSRPATSSSARRAMGMPEPGQIVTHRRSETTDGSASVPDSGGWEGSARTADSGKSEEKTECMSTARTSVESSTMRGSERLNGVNGAKRKSLVGSVSTPDLRSDSKGRIHRVEDVGRERDQRRKGEKGDSVFASMRELTRRPSLGKFKFWKKKEAGGFGGRDIQVQPPMPNVMGRRGREGGVSTG